ncbi:MAG TPA: CRISPR-associated endonuclease Cas1 [Candidatus Paceibacterota bacterium]|nr:CRISPR-associated endonuclease Cas1 [Candidatus Paceibacterota bacterium]
MDLLIDTYGTFIGSTGERLVLRLPSKNKSKKRIEKEYPIRRINKIVILRPSSISTHAVKLALEHEVDIVYLGSFGRPVGRIFSSDSKGLATTRRAQLEVSSDPVRALVLAKSFISGKCRSQITYMRYLMAKYGADFEKTIIQAETLFKTIDAIHPGTGARERLLGVEGFIAEKYWGSLKQLHKFPGRIPQGRDKFNSAINYGYGILYNEVERACLYIGLDPYIGLYHSERYGKPALVLDLVEEFRVPIVDSAIVPLFLEKKLGKRGDFEQVSKTEYRLSPEGKATVVEAVFNRLNQTVKWKRRQRVVKDVIQEQSQHLARYFLGTEAMYPPFELSLLI